MANNGATGYSLNHFGLSFDPIGNFVGPAQIREKVKLSKKADQYSGTFTIDQYNSSGNLLAEIKGTISAKLVTVNTTIGQVL